MGPSGPSRTGLGDVVDLGELRGSRPDAAQEEVPLSGEHVPGYYVTKAQPSMQVDGAITWEFWYEGPQGATQPLRLTMTPSLYMAMVSMAGRIMPMAAQRHAEAARKIAEFMRGAMEAAGEGESHGR